MLIVGVGPGDEDGVPAGASRRVADAASVTWHGPGPPPERALGRPLRTLGEGASPAPGDCVAAADPVAHRLAVAHPDAETWPERAVLRARAIGAEVAALAVVGAHLRRECPWDREQTAATIVPHTVEEAFEVAEAVASGGEGLADEVGDLLFQSVFLAQLLEEEGAADLASVARGQADKLVSRHPHVYGGEVAESAAGVVDVWERRKREERAGQGVFHDLPAGLPALAYATKACARAAAAGVGPDGAEEVAAAVDRAQRAAARLAAEPGERALGDALFSLVVAARALGTDPELALRGSARRFRDRVEAAAGPTDAPAHDEEAP